MLSIGLFIIALVLAANAAPSKDKDLFNCAYNYIDFKSFMNYSVTPIDEELCNNILIDFGSKNYDEIKKLVEEDSESVGQLECIMKNLRLFEASDMLIKRYVFQHDITMTEWRRQNALAEATEKLMIKLEAAVGRCYPERIYGLDFEDMFGEEQENNETTTSEEKGKLRASDITDLQKGYCWRLHLVDKKIIDTIDTYDVILNPDNVTVEGLDCDTIWRFTINKHFADEFDYLTGLFSDPSDNVTDCIKETLEKSAYNDNFARSWLVSQMFLIPEDKSAEKQKHIAYHTQLFEDAMKCKEKESTTA